MPNWSFNELRATNITKMPIFTTVDGEKDLDFNLLLPMPERLNVTAGGGDTYAVTIVAYEKYSGKWNNVPKNIQDFIRGFFRREQVTDDETFKTRYEAAVAGFKPGGDTPGEEHWQTEGVIPDTIEEARGFGDLLIRNIQDYGSANWYDWCYTHWGTKWNASDTQIVDDNTIRFDTAWSPPYGYLTTLSKAYPRKKFTCISDIEGDNMEYTIVFKNGQIIEEKQEPLWDDDDFDEEYE